VFSFCSSGRFNSWEVNPRSILTITGEIWQCYGYMYVTEKVWEEEFNVCLDKEWETKKANILFGAKLHNDPAQYPTQSTLCLAQFASKLVFLQPVRSPIIMQWQWISARWWVDTYIYMYMSSVWFNSESIEGVCGIKALSD